MTRRAVRSTLGTKASLKATISVASSPPALRREGPAPKLNSHDFADHRPWVDGVEADEIGMVKRILVGCGKALRSM